MAGHRALRDGGRNSQKCLSGWRRAPSAGRMAPGVFGARPGQLGPRAAVNRIVLRNALTKQEGNMNKIAIAFLTLSPLAIPAYGLAIAPQPAQSQCSLTEATSPSVRGVRLGMSLEPLLALF